MPDMLLRPSQQVHLLGEGGTLDDINLSDTAGLLGTQNPLMAANLATGAGKTLLSLVASSYWMQYGRRYTHVVILVHQLQLQAGWRKLAGKEVEVCPGDTLTILPLERTGKTELDLYLSLDNPQNIAITTYDVFRDSVIREKIATLDCSRRLVIPDEAHRAPEYNPHGNNLAITVALNVWRSQDGSILKPSATMNRSDNQEVLGEGYFVIEQTMVEQMIEREAPSQLLSELVTVPGSAEVHTQRDDAVNVPSDVVTGAGLMAQKWVDEGRPYSLVRMKSQPDAAVNRASLDLMAEAFREQGARVYVAYGDGAGFSDILDQEAKALQRGPEAFQGNSFYDVIIAIHKATEGTDSPIRSHHFLWGIPSNVNTLCQAIGRVMRKRTDFTGYPDQWIDQSKIVFFASTGSESLDLDHSVLLLDTITHMESYHVGTLWRHFQDGLERAQPESGGRTPLPPIVRDPKRLQEVIKVVLKARGAWNRRATKYDNALTGRELLKWILLWVEAHPSHFKDLDPPTQEEIQVVLASLQERSAVEPPQPASTDADNHAQDILDVVFEFRDDTLIDTFHRLTANDMRWYSDRIATTIQGRQKAFEAITCDQAVESARQFCVSNGYWPKLKDRDHLGFRFQQYDAGIKAGKFDQDPNIRGLAGLVLAKYPTRNLSGPDGTVIIEHWVDLLDHIQGIVQEDNRNRRLTKAHLCREWTQFPEVAYASGCYRVRDVSCARELELWEAHDLGTTLQNDEGKKMVEQIIGRHDVSYLKRALSDGTLRAELQ